MAGRFGSFRYDNTDHAALGGLLAARNLLGERHPLEAIDSDPTFLG